MKRARTSACPTTDLMGDLMTALDWADEQCESGQDVTLWCQHLDSLPEKGLADRLRRAGVRVMVEQRRGGASPPDLHGPVVAVGFNTLDRLIEIEPFEHPLCLVGVVRGVRKRPKERYAPAALERWSTDAQQSGS